MSLAYPLAKTAEDALKGGDLAARTRYQAEELAGDTPILALETEWLKPPSTDVPALIRQAEAGEAKGFIQIYEDADAKPVLAVTYWKLGKTPAKKKAAAKPEPEPKPKTSKPKAKQKPEELDHTDDLYFRHGRTRPSRKRKKHVDPRQMDLFVSPDQRGYEHKDPNNPNTMLTDEEGDGTTFGG
ncbi:MAG: hypothetical protein WA989_09405 [Henriciella sp.]|uniref:hypothetical protein n=1 Tax=Henriciella sp. TaxID=1968823 RepID=UPI003C73E797